MRILQSKGYDDLMIVYTVYPHDGSARSVKIGVKRESGRALLQYPLLTGEVCTFKNGCRQIKTDKSSLGTLFHGAALMHTERPGLLTLLPMTQHHASGQKLRYITKYVEDGCYVGSDHEQLARCVS